jgi:hypothetical protein
VRWREDAAMTTDMSKATISEVKVEEGEHGTYHSVKVTLGARDVSVPCPEAPAYLGRKLGGVWSLGGWQLNADWSRTAMFYRWP